MVEPSQARFDYALVGGGLQNALLALAVLHHKPQARVLMVERDHTLGGNHTWSFHAADVKGPDWSFVAPLVVREWPAHSVEFPNLRRRLQQSYASVTSERLDEVVREKFVGKPECELVTGVAAQSVEAEEVSLADGRRYGARLVVDARGPDRFRSGGAEAYQKFVGLELELAEPSPITEPVLMDATAQQVDGFRFFYVLPFAERRVLVEDTYYSDSAELDRERLRAEIEAYARQRSLQPVRVLREESGVLPLPTREAPASSTASPLSAGYQGGWFHPTTGYSFPIALRLASFIAASPPEQLFGSAWQQLLKEHRRQQRFALLLNRLLFSAFRPEERWNVLERFYRLPEPTILRFYAMATTGADRARVLVGRPPRGFSLGMLLRRGWS
jgi:lycopene beta-cyclase